MLKGTGRAFRDAQGCAEMQIRLITVKIILIFDSKLMSKCIFSYERYFYKVCRTAGPKNNLFRGKSRYKVCTKSLVRQQTASEFQRLTLRNDSRGAGGKQRYNKSILFPGAPTTTRAFSFARGSHTNAYTHNGARQLRPASPARANHVRGLTRIFIAGARSFTSLARCILVVAKRYLHLARALHTSCALHILYTPRRPRHHVCNNASHERHERELGSRGYFRYRARARGGGTLFTVTPSPRAEPHSVYRRGRLPALPLCAGAAARTHA